MLCVVVGCAVSELVVGCLCLEQEVLLFESHLAKGIVLTSPSVPKLPFSRFSWLGKDVELLPVHI